MWVTIRSSLCFILTSQQPPKSTLFPYTTLFRSLSRTMTSQASGEFLFPALPIGNYKLTVTKAGFSTYVQTGIVLTVNQDRKSTRLNSSHMSISYAVFCLKKKKGILGGSAGAVSR